MESNLEIIKEIALSEFSINGKGDIKVSFEDSGIGLIGKKLILSLEPENTAVVVIRIESFFRRTENLVNYKLDWTNCLVFLSDERNIELCFVVNDF